MAAKKLTGQEAIRAGLQQAAEGIADMLIAAMSKGPLAAADVPAEAPAPAPVETPTTAPAEAPTPAPVETPTTAPADITIDTIRDTILAICKGKGRDDAVNLLGEFGATNLETLKAEHYAQFKAKADKLLQA